MNLLITGAAGRLGYEVVKICSSEGFKIRAFDLPNVNWMHLENIDEVEIFKGDITDTNSVAEACSGINAVIHLAALLPPKTESSRELTQRINVIGTRNLLGSLNRETKMVFASSIATYGVTACETPPIKENHPQVSYNNYAESKIQAEKIVKMSNNPWSILRIAPISVADLLELPDIVAYREDQRIECVYVEDAGYALFSCLAEKRDDIYNIGGGKSWQMTGEEYIDRFYSALGVDVEPNYPIDYTAVDWYDTNKSRHLGYQRTNFNQFEERLVKIGEELGLR
jgi:nucleoside-diphosphate-sugar epimerase